MTILRQKIEDELNELDKQSMTAVYEHIKNINRLRRSSPKRRITLADIDTILKLTSSSKSSWADTVSTARAERL